MPTYEWPPKEESPPTPSTRRCVSCGRELGFDVNVCPYCGQDYRFIAPVIQKETTAKPVIGGVLVLLAGLLALVMAISFILIEPEDIDRMDYTGFSDSGLTPADIEDILEVCGALDIIFGAIAMIGGAFALMRKQFTMAVIGGVFGMLGGGFLIGSLLGLVGLVMIIISKSEFE